MINISHLNYKYSGSNEIVLKDISFKVNPKTITGIIGPNGSGKTTLMKLLSGLLLPDDFSEFDTGKDGEIALILGENQLYMDLTAFENIRYYLLLNKLRRKKDEILDVLSKVGLNGTENILVSKFSTGMKQKLNIAKVMLSQKKIIILDEPTSGLDPLSKLEVSQLLRNIQMSEENTILITSHSMKEVQYICDDILFINNGMQIFNGSKTELFGKYKKRVTELHASENFIKKEMNYAKSMHMKFYIRMLENESIIVINGICACDEENSYSEIIVRDINLEDIFLFETIGEQNV